MKEERAVVVDFLDWVRKYAERHFSPSGEIYAGAASEELAHALEILSRNALPPPELEEEEAELDSAFWDIAGEEVFPERG